MREAGWPVPRTLASSIAAAGAALALWNFAPEAWPRTHTTLLGLASLPLPPWLSTSKCPA